MTPVDPALVDEGFWIVRHFIGHGIVHVMRGKVDRALTVYGVGIVEPLGTPHEYRARHGFVFLRKLDLEELAEGEQ